MEYCKELKFADKLIYQCDKDRMQDGKVKTTDYFRNL